MQIPQGNAGESSQSNRQIDATQLAILQLKGEIYDLSKVNMLLRREISQRNTEISGRDAEINRLQSILDPKEGAQKDEQIED